MWIYSLLLIQSALALWYIRLFSTYTRAWNDQRGREEAQNESGRTDEVTILIAVRNEEKYLPRLFQSLERQTYTPLQVIFIDDHSEDDSLALISGYCDTHSNARFLRLPPAQTGKKQALSFAIAGIQTPWILCTDADTRMGPEWVSGMMNCAMETDAVFVSGPVTMEARNTWFSKWQALEFSGLIAVGASGIILKRPTMCNGANLLYQKKTFVEVGGFSGNEDIASGDDQFVMHRMYERYPGRIHFCMDQRALVYTETQDSLVTFVQQRIRWASKNGQFERSAVSFEMLGVWMVTAFLVMDGILGFYLPYFFMAFFVFFLTKLLAERHFYKNVLPFFQQTELLKNFWLAELFQVVYVFSIGLLGKFARYEWKGRKHARWN